MTRLTSELEAARDRFATDLEEVRTNLREELGWAPRGARWIVPIVALAVGVVAGIALRRNLPRPSKASARLRRGRRA